MKILVCVKQVPDTESKIKLMHDKNSIDESGIKWVVNPYDEYAIEEAIKIRERNPGTSILCVSAGPKGRCIEAVRTSLAMGVDEGAIVDLPREADAFLTAKALAKVCQREGPFDLILAGKLSIDLNQSSVAQFLAELLMIPHVGIVSVLRQENSEWFAEREVERGRRELFQFKLPALLTVNKGLNTPRYASLPGIMKAKKKTIKEISLQELELSAESLSLRFSEFELPSEKPPIHWITGTPIEQAREVVRLLKDEAKIL